MSQADAKRRGLKLVHSRPDESDSGESTPGESTPGASTPGESTPSASTPGTSVPGTSAPDSSSLIEFPAEIMIKAMGLNDPTFEPLVRGIVLPLIEPAQASAISRIPSSGGKYVSVRIEFMATSQSQLETIYRALRAESRVLFTL